MEEVIVVAKYATDFLVIVVGIAVLAEHRRIGTAGRVAADRLSAVASRIVADSKP